MGISSNSARFSSVEGSPSGPLTGSRLSPIHADKKIIDKNDMKDLKKKHFII
jgi:hypothetical protein